MLPASCTTPLLFVSRPETAACAAERTKELPSIEAAGSVKWEPSISTEPSPRMTSIITYPVE